MGDRPIWVHHPQQNFLSSQPMQKLPWALITNPLLFHLVFGKKPRKLKIQDKLKLFCWKSTKSLQQIFSKKFFLWWSSMLLSYLYFGGRISKSFVSELCTFMKILWRHSPWPIIITFFAVSDVSKWFLRNKIVHESFIPNIESFVSGALKTLIEHCNAWGNKQIMNLKSGE